MARDYKVYVSNNFIGVVGLTPEQIKELIKDYNIRIEKVQR